MSGNLRDLNIELEAATLLIQQLRDLEGISDDEGDAQVVADMIEGETGLLEAIDEVLKSIAEDRLLIAGIKEYEAQLETRRKRLEQRVEKYQWAVGNALRKSNQRKFTHPLCTISYAAGRKNAKVEITDESKLPLEYMVRADPRVDKRRLLADMKDGVKVEGAVLVDGEDGHRWGWK